MTHPAAQRDDAAARWQAGAHVITREIVHGKVWTARPVTVVRDDPDLVALYMMPGTIYKHPRLPDSDEVPGSSPPATGAWSTCPGSAVAPST